MSHPLSHVISSAWYDSDTSCDLITKTEMCDRTWLRGCHQCVYVAVSRRRGRPPRPEAALHILPHTSHHPTALWSADRNIKGCKWGTLQTLKQLQLHYGTTKVTAQVTTVHLYLCGWNVYQSGFLKGNAMHVYFAIKISGSNVKLYLSVSHAEWKYTRWH